MTRVLPPSTTGSKSVNLEICALNIDDNFVFHLWVDENCSERGVTPAAGVKGRDAHQAVDAGLGPQPAVGAPPLYRHGRALDAGLLPFQPVDDLLLGFAGVAHRFGLPGLFDGRDLLEEPAHRIADLGITRTFQNLALFPGLSVLENVKVGAQSSSRGGFVTAPLRLNRLCWPVITSAARATWESPFWA